MHQLISGSVCGEAIGSRCSLYKEKPELFLQATSAAAVGNTYSADDNASDANDVDSDSKRSFSGHSVDCIDSGIPCGYRTMIITRPKVKGAQSFAINGFKYSQTSKPHPLESAWQEAYRYTLRLSQKRQRRSIIEEFPGIENVVEDKAAPAFIQSIINALPLRIKIASLVRRSLLIDCISVFQAIVTNLQQPENAACNRCHYTGHTRDALFQNVPSAVARMVSMLAERKSSTALQYENKTSVKALNQSDPFPILGGANSDANRGDDQDVGTTDQGNAEPDDSNC
ncbi:unnamed protein product [Fusarium venenatum]|uniref:Uncharacterized protein n=1 Tax=Fusarium venenatum TaxID=56646 RepID=A0A2L2T261_9HYPO|nr:uncharacterized protein FVRRES_01234 [Fusarium venenatum]CEI64722.1 unnamed protein product [Fusarium venenatum]